MQADTRYGQLETPDAEKDIISRFLLQYGEWAWDEVCFLASVIPEGSNILDAGAFLGTFGLGLSLQRRVGKTCFVEANPAIFPLLQSNISRNMNTPFALISSILCGTTNLLSEGLSSGNNLGSTSFAPGSRGNVATPKQETANTLESLRLEYGPFHFIKLDVEGMEFEVLNSDSKYLSTGRSTIWVECNENAASLELAKLLLSWKLDTYYFAFPSFNPQNFKMDPYPIFPFAYEAGLLTAPKLVPKLTEELKAHGCILKQIKTVEECKTAMWQTPRWGHREWHDREAPVLAALAGRLLGGESYASYLQNSEFTLNSNVPASNADLGSIKNLQLVEALAFSRLRELEATRVELEKATSKLKDFETKMRKTLPRTVVSFAASKLAKLIPPPRNLQPKLTEHVQQALSPHFDSSYYLSEYPDVDETGQDPMQHFHETGWKQGRNPSLNFDTGFYLRRYLDVAAAAMNPLLHYAWAGLKEGRITRSPLALLRRQLASARPLRERAKQWGSWPSGKSINEAIIINAIGALTAQNGCIISISHDDYRANLGGVQNLIGDEERAFTKAGWSYFHLSPAKPLPMLADEAEATRFEVNIRVNGKLLGHANFAAFRDAIVKSKYNFKNIEVIVHHLMGHIPELIADLNTQLGSSRMFLWAHDSFAICPGYLLMRNDLEFCGAPPVNSAACSICCYGSERANHTERLQRFLKQTAPSVLAPSEAALKLWRKSVDIPVRSFKVVPLATLLPNSKLVDRPRSLGKLRIAHLGARAYHKGWPIFKELAERFRCDHRYCFLQLGSRDGDWLPSGIDHVTVKVGSENRNAMIKAVQENNIDIVIIWPEAPETFSYVVHEALAGGAYVIARRNMGNVWPAVLANAPDQGMGIEGLSELFELFSGSEIKKRVCDAKIQTHELLLGRGTADLVLSELFSQEGPTQSQSQSTKNIKGKR